MADIYLKDFINYQEEPDLSEIPNNPEPYPWDTEQEGGESTNMPKTLTEEDAIKSNSKYISFSDGESITATVVEKAIKEIPGYKGGKPKLGLSLVLATEYGDKIWENSSKNTLKQSSELGIKPKDTIKITRKGTGTETKYKIEIVA